jgi:hypothetical protein
MEYSDIVSHENSSVSNLNHKRSFREKKPTQIEDLGYIDKDRAKAAKNPILADVFKKCERTLQKIKRHPNAEYYMYSSNEDVPSIMQVEKKLKAYTYGTLYAFTLDVRKIWSYYFANYLNNPDIYQRTVKMSEYSEEAMREMETMNEEKSEIHELHKKVSKLSRELKEFKGTSSTPVVMGKKIVEKASYGDKPFTIQEKNILGNSIRSLPPEQLKGIVTILSDSLHVDAKKKFFEFDIETLSTRKLRELDKYVKSCMKKTGNPVKPVNGQLSENDKIAQLKVLVYYIE